MTRSQSYIHAWVRRQGRPVTLSEIGAAMDIGLAEALRRAQAMVEAGLLIDLGGDRLVAPPSAWDRPPTKAPEGQRKLWEAMTYRDMRGGAWTAKEIALVAEANQEYCRDYLRWLVGQGHVVEADARPGQAKRYRLHPDAPALAAPPIWRNKRNRALRRGPKKA